MAALLFLALAPVAAAADSALVQPEFTGAGTTGTLSSRLRARSEVTQKLPHDGSPRRPQPAVCCSMSLMSCTFSLALSAQLTWYVIRPHGSTMRAALVSQQCEANSTGSGDEAYVEFLITRFA